MGGHLYPSTRGQLGYPDVAWRNMAQGTLMAYTLGSGVVEGTIYTDAAGGILKGVGLIGFNEGALVFLVDGRSLGTIGSGAIDNWRTAWYGFNTTVSVRSATAQLVQFLVGTDAGSPFTWG